MELSIVMPCLNEAKTLRVCIEKAKHFLKTSGIDGEIIIADNGSEDSSIEIAKQLGARVVHVPVKGYGAALSEGIHAAEGQYVIMGDSDDSYNFLDLQPFIDKLREGYDLVMGNRFKGGIARGAMPFSHRYIGNPMLSALGRRIYDHEVCGDFYCGLRGFRREAIENLHIQSTGMEFALEMLIKAELYRLKITEVPTTLSPDGRDRKPHLKTYRDGWKSLRLYLLMSPRWTFGIPGILLAILGGLALATCLLNLIPVWAAKALLILGAVGIVLGYQSVLLAIFAKFIAIETGLHPPLTKFWALRESGTLERFLIAGAVISVLSVSVGLASAIFSISQDGGDPIPVKNSLQMTTLATTSLIVGGQTILAGFYFGILQLVTQRRQFSRKRRGD